jgi:hypothetical protein
LCSGFDSGGLFSAPAPTGPVESACCGEAENLAAFQEEPSESSDSFRAHADRTHIEEPDIAVALETPLLPVPQETDEQKLEANLPLNPKNQMELFIE